MFNQFKPFAYSTDIELPRIHYEKYNGHKYSYAYGAYTDKNSVNKVNVCFEVQNASISFCSLDPED